MGTRYGNAPGQSQHAPASATEEESRTIRLSAAKVLLVSACLGLIAGFVDLVSTVIQIRLFHGEFYRLNHGFWWIIPVGVATLVLVPGSTLAVVAHLLRRRMPIAIAVGLPSFVAFLDLIGTLPLELWASLLLSGGLAVQSARLVRTRQRSVLRLASLTTPPLAGVVLLLALATSGARAWSEQRTIAALPPPPLSGRNLLLIVWDTVRAANLSTYGYVRPTTPNLQRWAERGVRFEHAFATSSWTLPSHASLFTGRWPHELSAGWKSPLDATYPTLAGRLGLLGYDTAGFVANLDFCGSETGLGRGFAHYEDYPLSALEVFTRYTGVGRRIDRVSMAMLADLLTLRRRGAVRPLVPLSKEHAKSAADIERRFLAWLTWQRPRARPFFAFLNYNDAHTPYEVPGDFAPAFGIRPSSWHDHLVLQQWNILDKMKLPYRDVQMANDLYDDSIAYLDRRLGALLDELDRQGVLENTVVVVTADHGEHLGDHGLFFHGCSLYRQLVEVPLVVLGPNRVPAGRLVDEPVSLRDLPATVLDLIGSNAGAPFPGRSLTRFWEPNNRPSDPALDILLMETEQPILLTNQGREPVAKGPMKAMVAGGMHYIRSGDGGEELYALGPDRGEQFNMATEPNAEESLQGFRGALRSLFRKRPTAERRRAGPVASLPPSP
jgi:arylsulfatase A-like enzyme